MMVELCWRAGVVGAGGGRGAQHHGAARCSRRTSRVPSFNIYISAPSSQLEAHETSPTAPLSAAMLAAPEACLSIELFLLDHSVERASEVRIVYFEQSGLFYFDEVIRHLRRCEWSPPQRGSGQQLMVVALCITPSRCRGYGSTRSMIVSARWKLL